ncbi:MULTISPECIES: TetR/AcrR family transcriptional regulator [Methylobacterium]|uniref:TetR/AcrR family transcriptional regulator n=1 Tax=Methylobacterium TaxID=407 RepID=UPI0013ECA8F9|nr:TetR/AcrR family transcriptional regulator [Methylobacterium sp. DB0501]NGM35938.1 TetR/AcrR family transcriptional regulator [Methylobacterium sp. DB0501]
MSTSGEGTYHHGNLRRSLIAAAQALLRSGGIEAVTLREAARQAGVSHNAPYRHFPSREALLAAVAAEGFRTLHRTQSDAAAEVDPADRLKAFGRAYLRFAAEERATFRLMFGGTLDPADHPELAAVARGTFGALVAVTQEDATSGKGIVGRDALRAWALVHGLAHLVADRQIDTAQAEACLM